MERQQIMNEIEGILAGEGNREGKLREVCKILHQNIPYYSWVGFYMADEGKKELHLGPFVGEATEHVVIPFGRGICGQAAVKRETFLVPDVSKEENYLSCSPRVKSEIVVPVMKGDRMVAQLDIDSHEINAFSEEDKKFLEEVCERVAKLFD